MKKYILFTLLLFGITKANAQDGINNPTIYYKDGSITLDKEDLSIIDSFFTSALTYDKNDSLILFKNCYLIFSASTTKKDYAKNKLSGVLRCLKIIDYVESKYKINRAYFYICDTKDFDFYPKVSFVLQRRR